METWQITALVAVVNFAATFGGVVVALKSHASRIEQVADSVTRCHDRISDHINDHATGKVRA